MSNPIEVMGLSKTFGSTQALREINCTVKRGSIHGFLGPNGAGKTTTIKIILGMIPADGGDVRLFGERVEVGSLTHLLSRVGYLPQEPVFPEHFTGREVLEFTAAAYGIPYSKTRIKELLDEFDLTAAAKRKVKGYSTGMRQRLGLAAVLLPEPELLILDEPVSALDPEGRYMVLEKIKQLKGRATVFFSSHILADVERVCDTVTIISSGAVVTQASMDSLRQQYRSSNYLLQVVPQDLERAQQVLTGLGIAFASTDYNKLSFRYEGTAPAEVSRLILQPLLEQGVGIVGFSYQQATLEDIFLSLVNGGKSDEANAV